MRSASKHAFIYIGKLLRKHNQNITEQKNKQNVIFFNYLDDQKTDQATIFIVPR